MLQLPKAITVVEVAPRDGLQSLGAEERKLCNENKSSYRRLRSASLFPSKRVGIMCKAIIACFILAAFQSEAHAAGKLAYGSRAGMQVTVISMEGLDTARAIIRTQHTKEDALKFCEEYRNDVTDKCVQDELARRLSDEITANCDTGIFTNFFGYKIQFLGPNKQNTKTDYLLKNLATGEVADGSTASGYDVDLRIFVALCPRKGAIQFDPKTGFVVPPVSYIGKWYDDDPSVCKVKLGESNNNGNWPIGYTQKETFGAENICKIVRAVPRGSAVELSLLCTGEGMTSREKEIVEVIGGRLRRTSLVNGKTMTFTYSRCP